MPSGHYTRKPKPILERLLRKVEKTPDGCWMWTGSKATNGYGNMNRGPVGAGYAPAHRVSYEEHHGPIPDGHVVHHTCRHPLCVNPAHLVAMSPREHVRLHVGKTHCPRGHSYKEHGYYRKSTGALVMCRECRREQRKAKRSL